MATTHENPSTAAATQKVVAPGPHYSAVWTRSTAGEIQVYGWTYEDYRKKYDELWAQGWRLKLLQPFVLSGNQVRYTAVWQQSTAGEIQVYGWTYEDYRKKYDELWAQGWRLKLLQPFVLSGNQVRYTAVWQQSTAGEIQVYGWTYEDYRKKYDELWAQGWRLKLLQPFVLSGNQVRYTAVWQQSTAGEIQVYGWTYEDYRKKYDELWAQGWRLKLLQPFVLSGNQVRYTAVWQQSTAGEIQVYGWTYEDYRKKYDELWAQGWRLKAIQPYVTRPAPPKIRIPGRPDPTDRQLIDRAVRAYTDSGGVASAIGVPMGPVRVTGTEGRWDMSGGQVVVRQDGSTSLDVDQNVKVWFVGFKCFEESGELSERDEPYFVISWAGNKRSVTTSFGPYSVNKGDEVIVPTVLADDLPVVTGSVHVAVYENDEGSTAAAREKVAKAMKEIAEASAQAAALYDMSQAAQGNTGTLGPAAQIAGLIVGGPLGLLVGKGLVVGLGLADDYVGQQGATVFGADTGYVDPPILGRTSGGEPYTHRFWVNSDGAGDYEVYLRVQIIDRPRAEPG